MEQKRISSDFVYTAIYWGSLVLALVLSASLYFKSNPIPIYDRTMGQEETLWVFGQKDGPQGPTHLSMGHYFEPGVTYELTTHVSYDGSKDDFPSAILSSSGLEIKAYVNNELTFSYTAEDKPIPRIQSVGTAIFPVPLGKDSKGTILRLELKTPYDHRTYERLPQVAFGDHSAHVRELFLSSLPSMLISAAITFAVIILVMLGNTVDGTQWTYIYFSLFAVVIVLFRTFRDPFLVYVTANPFMAEVFEFFSVAAGPIPLLMSCRSSLKPYGQKAFNFLITASILNLTAQVFLHFMGILDVTHMVVFTHSWLLICAVSLLIVGILVKKKTGREFFLRKLMPILLGTVLDIMAFYSLRFDQMLGSFYSVGDFSGIGLLMSLSILILEARKGRIKAYREQEQNRILEKLAYQDALTGVSNRAAFSRDLHAIEAGAYAGRDLLMVSADVNGLKSVNDTLGHIAGDDLIQRAAFLLQTSLGVFGTVYRTGGDEFFAILPDLTGEQWAQIRQAFLRILEDENQDKKNPLSIALGSASYDGKDLTRCIQQADERMYENKGDFHRQNLSDGVRS